MDLSQLEIFTRVVEEGGFTAASRALGIPKSSVSRKVAQLEDSLGARLLNRTTRRVEPTEVGAAFYERCARIMESVRDAESSVVGTTDTPRGTLRITAPIDLGDSIVGVIAAEYLTRYPEVDLFVDLSGRMVDLVAEGFDLAIRAGNLPDSSLVARKLSDSPTGFYASPDYVARRGSPRTPAELCDHDCIVYVPPAGHKLSFEATTGGKRTVIDLEGRLRVNELSAAKAAAIAGAGIAFQPVIGCAADVEAGRLVRVLEDTTISAGALHVVYPPNPHLPAKVRTFIDLLVERIDALI